MTKIYNILINISKVPNDIQSNHKSIYIHIVTPKIRTIITIINFFIDIMHTLYHTFHLKSFHQAPYSSQNS